jgi:hypothetical protein
MIQVKGLLRRKAYRHNKKLLKGRNRTTFVSAIVIHTVLSPKVISTNLGVKTLYVVVEKTGSNKSINVLDSEGARHCQNISGEGQETLTFENVTIEENKPLTVTYNFSKCTIED